MTSSGLGSRQGHAYDIPRKGLLRKVVRQLYAGPSKIMSNKLLAALSNHLAILRYLLAERGSGGGRPWMLNWEGAWPRASAKSILRDK